MSKNRLGDKGCEELVKILLDSVSRLARLDIRLCEIGSKAMTAVNEFICESVLKLFL